MPFKFNPLSGNLDYYESATGGSGDVVGPASATDNAVARFDSTTGKLIQDSGVIIDDSENITGVNSLAFEQGKLDTTTPADWGAPVHGLIQDQDTADQTLSVVTVDHANNSTNAPGYIYVSTGSKPGAASTGFTGPIYIRSGNNAGSGDTGEVVISSGFNSGTGDSGRVDIYTDTSVAGDSGDIFLSTGVASGGISGDVNLIVGTGGTQGTFKFLKTGVPSVSGHSWIASSTDGTGYWDYVAKTTTITPVTDAGASIGSTSLRYNEFHARRLRIVHPGSTTFLGTLNSGSNYLINSVNSTSGSITMNVGAASAPATVLANILTTAGTNTINVTGNQSVFIGGFADVGGGLNTNTLTIDVLGAIGFGVCYNSFGATGSSATYQSLATGATIIGAAFHNNFGGAGSARLTAGVAGGATGRGAFVQGAAFPSSFALTYSSVIEATADGSMARGFAGRGLIRATGAGAAVSAYMLAGNDTAAFLASGLGSAIFGANNGGTGNATASGNGATINCYLTGANNVTASGEASGCWGNPSTADIVASATMAFQFCEGTNSEARSLKIGIAGAGIRLMGTTTAPATPANGDLRVNSTGTMINRSNGFLYTMGTPYVAKTGNYTLVAYDDYTVNVTSGTNTQTLPTAVGYSGGIFTIKNTGTGTVTVATTSSQTFDNDGTTLTLIQNECVTVQSNNANWIILSRY